MTASPREPQAETFLFQPPTEGAPSQAPSPACRWFEGRFRYLLALAGLLAHAFASYFVLRDAVSTQQARAARLGLMSVLALFRDSHQPLSTGDPKINPPGWPSRQVKLRYFGELALDRQVQDDIAHAEAIAARPDARIREKDLDLEYILDRGSTTMLKSLDMVGVWFSILEPQERELLRRAELIRADAERYAYLAAHDSLTGLLNRGGFRDATPALLETSGFVGEPIAFLLVDRDCFLACFKEVNDTLGHPIGDRVLVEVARIGGDEFALVFPLRGDDVLALGERTVRSFPEVSAMMRSRMRIARCTSRKPPVGIAYASSSPLVESSPQRASFLNHPDARSDSRCRRRCLERYIRIGSSGKALVRAFFGPCGPRLALTRIGRGYERCHEVSRGVRDVVNGTIERGFVHVRGLTEA